VLKYGSSSAKTQKDTKVTSVKSTGGFQDEVFAFFTMRVWKSPKNITLFVKFFILPEYFSLI